MAGGRGKREQPQPRLSQSFPQTCSQLLWLCGLHRAEHSYLLAPQRPDLGLHSPGLGWPWPGV